MEEINKSVPLKIALIPVLFLIGLLSVNVIGVFGDDALSGSNQFILILSASLTVALGMYRGTSWSHILKGIEKSIADTSGAIIIILLIGALAGSWMISGIVPAMVYYGLMLLSPSIFLPATAIICATVSLATGSSWSTSATVGIALVGIGQALGMNEAIVAGAVISGAYFGDKLSPMSDTTNLAPAVAGTDLFTHIRYMLYTTLPSFIIALVLFAMIGLFQEAEGQIQSVSAIMSELAAGFNLSLWLFLVPVAVIAMIIMRVPAIPALLIGALAGIVFALNFQSELLVSLSGGSQIADFYRVLMNSLTVDMAYPAEHPVLKELLSSGGMSGMLGTIWLILAAMIFGGSMEATGFLHSISVALLRLAKGTFSLIATTVGTTAFMNVSAGDQYLALVVPGKMFKEAYEEKDLAPENLSRTLEDSGTVTSVLVPHNTCGAYQSGVLGVDTMAYLPYAFFNYLSPIMTLIYAAFNIKIRKLIKKD